MPTRGKCMSCGETTYLNGIMVKNVHDGHYEFWMVCDVCRKYYEWKGKSKDDGAACKDKTVETAMHPARN